MHVFLAAVQDGVEYKYRQDGVQVRGTAPVPPEGAHTWEAGLPFEAVVKTLPWVQRTQTGSALGLRQSRIVEVVTEFVGKEGEYPVQYRVNDKEAFFGQGRIGGRVNTFDRAHSADPSLQVRNDRQRSIFGWRGYSATEVRFTEYAKIAGLNQRISTG